MIQPHDTGGWLIKDPVSLQYSLLSSLEYQVFQKLDGTSDLRTIFSGSLGNELTPQDVESFLSHLIKRQLLFRPDGGDAERFNALKPSVASPFAWATRLLSWHVPLGNPRSLLTKLQWVNSIVFQKYFSHASVNLFAWAIVVASLNQNRFVAHVGQLANSFSTSSVAGVLVILIVVKLAHELGHALSARHYGTDCHEAGILFLFLTPLPFTNVTDSWRLPVAQRMVVTAAGIIVELWIACCCIILWSIAADGLTKDLLLQTALICSLNTLLFNGNPLLKFDGYFLLSDYLRIPNLSQRSAGLIRSITASFLSGQSIDSSREKTDRKALITYGLLAGVYRILLAFSILEAIHFLCSSNDLRAFGWLLNMFAVTMLIGIPAAKFLVALIAESPTGMTAETVDLPKRSTAGTFYKGLWRSAAVLTFLSLVIFVPIPSRIICDGTITPFQQRVYAAVTGRLAIDSSDEGQQISNDSWRLIKMESRSTRLRLQAEQQLASVQLDIANRTGRSTAGPSIRQLQEALESAEARLSEFDQTLSEQIRPISSTSKAFIPARRFRAEVDGAFDEDWTGLPLSPQNLGAEIEEGTTLGYFESDQMPIVTAWVPESHIQKIQIGQSASFRLAAGQSLSLQATVKQISRFPADTVPPNMAVSANLKGRTTESGFQPDATHYAVTIQLTDKPSVVRLPLNGVGHVSVKTADQSLASRFYDYLRRTFVFSARS